MVCPRSQKKSFFGCRPAPGAGGAAGHGAGSGFVNDLCGCQPDRLETLGPDAHADGQITHDFSGNREPESGQFSCFSFKPDHAYMNRPIGVCRITGKIFIHDCFDES